MKKVMTMSVKATLRNEMKLLLRELDADKRDLDTQLVHQRLQSLDLWKESKGIAVTVSRGSEMDTLPLIQLAWLQKKRVAVPKCDPVTKQMTFRCLTSFDQLESVYYGLMEPIENKTTRMSPEELDVMIVPGVCFDKWGYRVGHGGGYYDRYLVHYKGQTVSLAFDEQVRLLVPHEAHDIPVQWLVTPSRVIHPTET